MNCRNLICLAACLLVVSFSDLSGQGTISLNTATGSKPRIQVNGVNAVTTDNIWVQILLADRATIDPFQLTLGGANAGLFSKGTYTAAGLAAGTVQTLTVRAWDKDTGTDYTQATVKCSTSFNVTLEGNLDPFGLPFPTTIVGAGMFMGLEVTCPEPSTYALAALGLGCLLLVRLN